MLVLTRNEESAISIGTDIKVKVLSIKRKSVKLGVEAPQSLRVWRNELPATIDEQEAFTPNDQANSVIRAVLVIEDDPGHAKLIRKALRESQGTKVTLAGTARSALDALGARVSSPDDICPPDLILLDLGLPDGSGLDLLRMIRSVPELRSTPIVVLSCNDDESIVKECMESGANAFVPKSAGYDDFRSQVSRIGQFWAGDCIARRALRDSDSACSAALPDDVITHSTDNVELEEPSAEDGFKRILVADDDAGHVALIKRALQRAPVTCTVDVVSNGVGVMDYLFGMGQYAARGPNTMPDLILLDLNMPEMNGRQVLQMLRSTRAHGPLRLPPLVVLTSSDEDTDINDSYRLGAQSFIRKPADHARFVLAVQQTTQYWLGLNQGLREGASPTRQASLPR
jgi:two-component system response regulator